MKMVIMSTLLYCNECNVINGENSKYDIAIHRHKSVDTWILGREEAPEHFFRRTAITSPDCQEFMV